MNNKFISKLGLLTNLNGHRGCVNCLQWNDSGRYLKYFLINHIFDSLIGIIVLVYHINIFLLLFSTLASASDDFQVILWDPLAQKIKTSIKTLHRGNIFTVKVRFIYIKI